MNMGIRKFILQTRAIFPMEVYREWHKTQNQKWFELELSMWKNLLREEIRIITPLIQVAIETGDLPFDSVEDAIRMGFVIHSYHHWMDCQVKKEIENITGGTDAQSK